MSSIIHLDIIMKHAGPPDGSAGSGQDSVEPEERVRKSYTPAMFRHVVGELEQMIRDQSARIRLVVEDTSDVQLTMQHIGTASALLHDHLMETIPEEWIQDSLVKEHAVSDENTPIHIRFFKYLRYNPLKTFVLILVIVGAGFAVIPEQSKRAMKKIYSAREKIYTQASLPIESGWILLGHYNDYKQRYTDGPYAMIIKSPHDDGGEFIRTGDVIVLTKTLGVVIVGYNTDGVGQVLEPPWKSDAAGGNDYTGIEINEGHKVRVLDVGFGSTDTYLREVWARVANLEE